MEGKRERIEVSVSKQQKADIKALARHMGISVNNLMIVAIHKEIKRIKEIEREEEMFFEHQKALRLAESIKYEKFRKNKIFN